MYINQILTYLVWPVFILVSWYIIKSAVILYDRKFPVVEAKAEEKNRSEKERDQ